MGYDAPGYTTYQFSYQVDHKNFKSWEIYALQKQFLCLLLGFSEELLVVQCASTVETNYYDCSQILQILGLKQKDTKFLFKRKKYQKNIFVLPLCLGIQ